MKERLTPNDLREVEEDTYLIVELHEDEYWMQGEGNVSHVKENRNGSHTVVVKGRKGHRCRLKIPSDARKGMTYDGAARGAKNLRVTDVYKRE